MVFVPTMNYIYSLVVPKMIVLRHSPRKWEFPWSRVIAWSMQWRSHNWILIQKVELNFTKWQTLFNMKAAFLFLAQKQFCATVTCSDGSRIFLSEPLPKWMC